jgi:hypothetical protein
MKVNSAMLKIIGMITMVLLNLTMFGIVEQPFLRTVCGVLGTSSITVFAFLITEGYRRTSNINKYVLRVLVFAVISAFPYHAIMKLIYEDKADITGYFSAGLTAFICLCAIATYDKIKEKRLKYVFVFFVCVLSYFINFYWAPFAFVLVFIIHICRDDFRKMAYYIISLFGAFFIVGLVFKMMNYENQSELDMMIYQVGCILPLPLIAKYNGQEGVKLKWIVYVFYVLMLICFMLLLLLPKNADLLSLLF